MLIVASTADDRQTSSDGRDCQNHGIANIAEIESLAGTRLFSFAKMPASSRQEPIANC